MTLPGLGGGAAELLRLTWVKGQSGLVHLASYLQFGWTKRHLSPNLQLGNVLQEQKSKTRAESEQNDSVFLLLNTKHSLALCCRVMIQTLVSALTDRPELASLHRLLFLYRESIFLHYLHIHHIICQKRTAQTKSTQYKQITIYSIYQSPQGFRQQHVTQTQVILMNYSEFYQSPR